MKNKKKILSLIACLSLLTSCNKTIPSTSSCKTTTSTPNSSITPEPEVVDPFSYAITETNGSNVTLTGFDSSLTDEMKLKIEEIRIPENITALNNPDYGLFKGFTNLKRIYIPKTLTTINFGSNSSVSQSPFIYLPSLENIEVDEENLNFKVFPNSNCILNVNNDESNPYTFIAGWKDIVLPEELTEIRKKGWHSYPFANLNSVTSITFHSKITTLLNDDLFINLPNLQNVHLNGLEGYAIETNVLYDTTNYNIVAAWLDCTIPSFISSPTLSNFSSVTSVNLDGVKNLGARPFSGTKIKKIHFPASLETYSGGDFLSRIDNLEEVTSDCEIIGVKGNCVYDTKTKTALGGFKDVVIPEEVEILTNYSFRYNYAITSIHISKNVKSIAGEAFNYINRFREYNDYFKMTLDSENPYFYISNENGCFSLIQNNNDDPQLIYILPNKNKEIITPSELKSFNPLSEAVLTTNFNSKHVNIFKFNEGLLTINATNVLNGLFYDKTEDFNIALPSTLKSILTVSNNSVTSPFCFTTMIKSITINSNNNESDYFKIEGNLLIKKGKTDGNDDLSKDEIICGFSDVEIPERFTSIPAKKLRCNYSITSLTLHKNIISVGQYGLNSLNSLTKIKFKGTLNEFKTYLYSQLKTIYPNVDVTYLNDEGIEETKKMNEL